ncbi:MAG: DegV family protein [Syntrophothermus sp.]
MQRVKIVTDSTADLPEELIKKHGIKVVPLNVHFGEEVFQDGVDLWPEEFYLKLKSSPDLPRTSQPSPGLFVEAYRELAADGSAVVSIHISSKMSGTLQSAQLAKDMLPELDITVIDSLTVCTVMGLVVLAAARAAESGAGKEEVVAVTYRAMKDTQVYFVVDTLEYLQMNGRIGRATAMVGTLLSIKPLLTIKEGEVTPVEKIRGKAKAIDRIFELMRQEVGGRKVRMAVMTTAEAEEAQNLAARARQELPCEDVVVSNIGAVIGSHVGPGTIAIAYQLV